MLKIKSRKQSDNLLLNELPEDKLDEVLSLSVEMKADFFKELVRIYYGNVDEDSDNFVEIVEAYISSFYAEKLYRSNAFFREKFTPMYTRTGLIKNIVLDLFHQEEKANPLTIH